MHIPYLAHTAEQRQQMLQTLGMSSVQDLFVAVPQVLQDFELDLPQALSELDLQNELTQLSAKNISASQQMSFVGGGAYRHYVPAGLSTLAGRSEFLTAYTPYQAEMSQGTLQVIYEFQSALCAVTGMDIANASTYEGASACAEAMAMACRITKRKDILITAGLHPEYLELLQTYAKYLEFDLHSAKNIGQTIDLAAWDTVESPAALIVQYPDFCGQVSDLQALADWIHAKGGLLIVAITDPVVLGLLEAPGKLGADIVAGEAQAFGNGLSYGGPYVGFLTAKSEFIRQMPGRMSGMTLDADGQRAFTLVLQTREQHIRREKATSNICTNQGLNALIATIWLALIGKQGLQELADISFQRAHELARRLQTLPKWKLAFDQPFMHEFVMEFDGDLTAALQTIQAQGCLPGLPLSKWYPQLDRHLLINVTEMNSVTEIDKLFELMARV